MDDGFVQIELKCDVWKNKVSAYSTNWPVFDFRLITMC